MIKAAPHHRWFGVEGLFTFIHSYIITIQNYNFTVIFTTHSTCHDTFILMSNIDIAVKSVLGKQSDVDFCAWEYVSNCPAYGIVS